MTSFNKFSSDLNRDIDSSKLFKRINFKFCPKCNNRVIMDTVYCDNCNFEFKDEKNYFESKYYLNKMIEIISLLEKGYTLEDTSNEVNISVDDINFMIELGHNGSKFHLDFYNLVKKLRPEIINKKFNLNKSTMFYSLGENSNNNIISVKNEINLAENTEFSNLIIDLDNTDIPVEEEFEEMEYGNLNRKTIAKIECIIMALKNNCNLDELYWWCGVPTHKIRRWLALGYKGDENFIEFYNQVNQIRPDVLEFLDYTSQKDDLTNKKITEIRPDILNQIKHVNSLNKFKINHELYSDIQNFLNDTKILNESFDKKNYQDKLPLLAKWNGKNLNLDQIIYDDLVLWCCNLISYSGLFNSEHYKFMEYYFNLNSDFIDNMDNGVIGIYTFAVPLSIYLCMEIDEFQKNNHKLTNIMFSLLKEVGNEVMIYCKKTEDIFNHYTKFIDKIDSFIKPTVKKTPKSNKSKENTNVIVKSGDNPVLQEYLNKLNELVGLNKVKNEVNTLINIIKIRKLRDERGMPQPPMSNHLVFSGNPGTGKTTVARLLANIYHELGVLSEGHLVETDRSGLVAGYVGQTAIKVKGVIDEAMGGILFIDEAYALSSPKSSMDYGQEAIDTILKVMEDNRDDLIVIVAGYPDLMEEFLNSNPGLKSRFNKFIHFDDYEPDELFDIFMLMCKNADLTLDSKAEDYLKEYLQKLYENRDDNFANGRDVRNLFENVLVNQANRLANDLTMSTDELTTLKYEDFIFDKDVLL